MAPRKAPAHRGDDPVVDAPVPSTSTSTASTANGHGTGAMPMLETERSGDDQQISQILAEMAQQGTASKARSHTAALEFGASGGASPADSTASLSIPSLPNVSSDEHGVVPAPVASTSNAFPTTAQHATNGQTSGSGGGEEDELANSGEGDEGGEVTRSYRSAGVRGKSKKGDKRARGNGDEHKSMTEEEWEKSRKANHKEVERRRRETINAGLDALAALLPSPPPPPPGSQPFSRPVKPNKSEVLGQGIEYIQNLKKTHQADTNKWTLEKLLKDQEIKKGQAEIEKLKEENEELRKRIEQLEAGQGGGRIGQELENGNHKRRRLDEAGPA